MKILANELKLPLSDFTSLQQLLATKQGTSSDELVVTIERFGQIVQWFGAFFLPSEAPSILADINTLINSSWFHGDISKDVAEKRLYQRDAGEWNPCH